MNRLVDNQRKKILLILFQNSKNKLVVEELNNLNNKYFLNNKN